MNDIGYGDECRGYVCPHRGLVETRGYAENAPVMSLRV